MYKHFQEGGVKLVSEICHNFLPADEDRWECLIMQRA